MILTISHRPNVTDCIHSFGKAIENASIATAQKIKAAVTSSVGQGVIGFGLGAGMHNIYGPLTEKIVTGLGVSAATLADPFMGLSLGWKTVLTPFVCVLGPIWEERMFRGNLQETLEDKFQNFYLNRGLKDSAANIAARISSIFFTSVVFGLIHFQNALVFWCNPILFLPQVVAATLMGIIFSVAKDLTRQLHMPNGMHIGNNTYVWANYIRATL